MTNRAIEVLKTAGMDVKPGAMLPFINIQHRGQMFRWEGPVDQGAVQIAKAKSQLEGCGFNVEFVDPQDQVIHAIESQQEKMDYTITIQVDVTANSPEEAARFALDDLRDKSIKQWNIDVEWTREGTPITQTISVDETAK